MTVQFGNSGGIALSPSSLRIPAGGCVQFGNNTPFLARITVGSSYSEAVGGFSHTSGKQNYTARPAGTTQKVRAAEVIGSANGSIVIAAAPNPSPTPARRATTPSSAPPPQPAPTHAATSQPPSTTRPRPSASPPPTGAAITPSPSQQPPFLSGQPTPSASASPAVVAGPLQPPTGRGTGLPAAVAALAVVATAAALLRVLLAEPVAAVDDRRSVGAAL
jgi:hypothetical protein